MFVCRHISEEGLKKITENGTLTEYREIVKQALDVSCCVCDDKGRKKNELFIIDFGGLAIFNQNFKMISSKLIDWRAIELESGNRSNRMNVAT